MSCTTGLTCVRCRHNYEIGKLFSACPACLRPASTAGLTVTYDYEMAKEKVTRASLRRSNKRGLWRYKELLPVEKKEHMLEVGDGDTPMVWAKKMGEKLGIKRLYFKDESRNLTWSFKDRLACVGVGKALDFGARVITCLSTGNHGAASAAHASAASLHSVIFTVPYIPKTMLAFMLAYGAKVVPMQIHPERFGDFPYSLMEKCVRERGWCPLTTYVLPPAGNPYGAEGYKTIAYEICEDLGWDVPDVVVFPTGHGEGLSRTWKGFLEMSEMGLTSRKPMMVAVQPHGAAPLVEALKGKNEEVPPISAEPTLQFSTGVNSTSLEALLSLRESKGTAVSAKDEDVLDAQGELARNEGIFAEPSSASSLAALNQLMEEGFVDKGSTVICVITSSGMKDPRGIDRDPPEMAPIEENWDAFTKFMAQQYDFKV